MSALTFDEKKPRSCARVSVVVRLERSVKSWTYGLCPNLLKDRARSCDIYARIADCSVPEMMNLLCQQRSHRRENRNVAVENLSKHRISI